MLNSGEKILVSKSLCSWISGRNCWECIRTIIHLRHRNWVPRRVENIVSAVDHLSIGESYLHCRGKVLDFSFDYCTIFLKVVQLICIIEYYWCLCLMKLIKLAASEQWKKSYFTPKFSNALEPRKKWSYSQNNYIWEKSYTLHCWQVYVSLSLMKSPS